jgi:hypothetical protein
MAELAHLEKVAVAVAWVLLGLMDRHQPAEQV